MFLFLLYVLALITSSCASIPASDIKIKVFDKSQITFEEDIAKAVAVAEKYYEATEAQILLTVGKKGADKVAEKTDEKFGKWLSHLKSVTISVSETGLAALANVPLVAAILELIPIIYELIDSKPDWKEAFAKTILDRTRQDLVNEKIADIKAHLDTIQTNIRSFNNTDLSDSQHNVQIAMFVINDLNPMIVRMKIKASVVQQYPMLMAPIVAQIGVIVSTFAPIAKTIIPDYFRSHSISCKMLDVLEDYAAYIVPNRMFKVSSKNYAYLVGKRTEVFKLPYNPSGYNEAANLDCESGSYKSETDTYFNDKFGERYRGSGCLAQYLRHVRYETEKLFPIAMLKETCPEPRKKTGFGYLTFFVGHVQAYSSKTLLCDPTSKCDVYIKVYVNNIEVEKTDTVHDVTNLDAGIIYRSKEKIRKESTIKVVVWDADTIGSDENILTASGTIQSFIDTPIRTRKMRSRSRVISAYTDAEANFIETKTIWLHEYA